MKWALMTPEAAAQEITATITGTVTDASGAVVNGANVKLTNEGTNAELTTTAGTGASIEVESIGSCPDIASCSRAASSTVRPNGPGVSREDAKATTPYREEPP